MSVVGIDPGINGAIAMYGASGLQYCDDVPTFHMKVGKTVRARIDPPELFGRIEMLKMMGAELVIIEQVGGRPKQSASGAFVLGQVVGMIYMACVGLRLPIETVVPGLWKKTMKMPGKTVTDPEDGKRKIDSGSAKAIMARGLELMPNDHVQFHGPKGGVRLDRVEAAMLAMYGYRHVLGSVEPTSEWRMNKIAEGFR